MKCALALSPVILGLWMATIGVRAILTTKVGNGVSIDYLDPGPFAPDYIPDFAGWFRLAWHTVIAYYGSLLGIIGLFGFGWAMGFQEPCVCGSGRSYRGCACFRRDRAVLVIVAVTVLGLSCAPLLGLSFVASTPLFVAAALSCWLVRRRYEFH